MKIGVGSKNKTKINAVTEVLRDCPMFDGKQIHLGLSQACEWPKKVLEKILDGLDGSQAMKAVGLTQHEKLGEHEGLVGILTKGRTNRTEFNKGAVVMALMHLENPEHF